MTENRRPYKRSMKNFLIMKELQLKFAVTIILLLLVMFGFFTLQTSATLKMIYDQGVTVEAGEKIQYFQMTFGGVYLVFILFFSIYLSHRIAGPLYRIEKDLKALSGDGDLTRVFRLRKNDEMQEVAQAINVMLTGLRDRIAGAREEREEALEKIVQLADGLCVDEGSPEEKAKSLESLKAAADDLCDIDDRYFKI